MTHSIQQNNQSYQDFSCDAEIYQKFLSEAIRQGNIETARKIFNVFPSAVLEGVDCSGVTPLHSAITHQQLAIAKFFIEQMNLSQLCKREEVSKKTAMEWAFEKHDLETLSALDQRINKLITNPKHFNEFFKGTQFEKIQWNPQFQYVKRKFGLLKVFKALITLQEQGIHSLVGSFGAMHALLAGKKPVFIAQTTDELLSHYFPAYKALSAENRKEIREYLRRVNKSELAVFSTEIQQLRPLKGTESQALKGQNWAHPIFQNPQVHLLALREFIEGRISNYDLSEILIYDQCLRGDVQSDFAQAISIGKDKERASALLIRSIAPYFSEEDIAKFLAEPSLQNCQFYVIPLNYLFVKGPSVLYQIVKLKHTFLTYKEGKHIFQVVMSPRLLTVLYRLKFGDQTPYLNAVLGPSISAENFTDPTKRDVLVPSRLFPQSQPTQADGYAASSLEFWHHDAVYHVYLGCLNPHRKLFLEIAQFAKNHGHQSVYLKLLDQEFFFYEKFPPNKAFFETIKDLYVRQYIIHDYVRDAAKSQHLEISKYLEADKESLKQEDNLIESQHLEISMYLEANKERLKQEYNLILPPNIREEIVS